MFSSAKKVAESMGIDIPIICCNGALIRRASDGEVLYYKTFDEAIAKQIVDFLWNNDIVFQTYYKDDVLIPMYSPYAHWYSSRYEVSCKILSDINGFKESPPAKIMIIEPSYRIEEIRNIILKKFTNEIKTMRADVNMLEIMVGEASKGIALSYLADNLGISLDEVMAIGDSENDLDMLLKSGYPVAVENAMEKLKDIAKLFVSSNENDGVAEAIEKYILPQFKL